MIFGIPPRHRPVHRPHFRPHARGFAPRYATVETYTVPQYLITPTPTCVSDTVARLPPCPGAWVRRGNVFCCEG